MDQQPNPRFDLWVPAIDAGLLRVEKLVAWADEQIAQMDKPSLWLIELSCARNAEGVRRARASVPGYAARDPSDEFDERLIYLGSLYLAYETGRLPMDKLLLEAGRFADGRSGGGVPECEAFYYLLNEIDGGGPTRQSDRPLADRVQDLFAPMASQARAALVDLPTKWPVRNVGQ